MHLPGNLDDPLIVASLICLLAMMVGVASFFVWLAGRQVRARRAQLAEARGAAGSSWAGQSRYHTSVFDSPCRWLAIRSIDPQAVQSALNLHNPTSCSWEEGLVGARDQKLFISPPVGDWILVVGPGLPDPGDDPDLCFHFLTRLSRKVGHVQFFCVNRVLHHHAWARLDEGRVHRAYAWAGQTVWNQGPFTLMEAKVGLKCYNYFEQVQRGDFSQHDPVASNTEKVPMLAARWSVDPSTIDDRQFKSGHGIAGDLSR